MNINDDAVKTVEMKNGWKIVKRSTDGLTDPQDGFKTPKYEWHIYRPGEDCACGIVNTKSAAVSFVNYRNDSETI